MDIDFNVSTFVSLLVQYCFSPLFSYPDYHISYDENSIVI